MAEIIRSKKPLAVSPVKSGQPLGAILASMGFEQSIPLVHGAQGCSASRRSFLSSIFTIRSRCNRRQWTQPPPLWAPMRTSLPR